MFAFLFDESHPSAAGLFGPACAAPILTSLWGRAETHIFVGALLHDRFAYRLDLVEHRTRKPTDPPWKGGGSLQKMTAGNDRFRTIVCDLAETLSGPHSTLTEERLFQVLGRKPIWTVVTTSIDWQNAVVADKACGVFEPYLGMVKVDAENPVHRYIFHDVLFDGKFLSMDGLLERRDEEAGTYLTDYGIERHFSLSHDEYEERVPKFVLPSSVSASGERSIDRARGPELSYRERFAAELLEGEHSRDFQFSTKPTSGLREFQAREEKLRLYLLNPDHPTGGAKAKFFTEVLGITPADWRYLADQLVQGVEHGRMYRVAVTQWEFTHGAVLRVTGRNGRVALVETGWKLQANGPTLLVTAYPYVGVDQHEVMPVQSRVPELPHEGEAYHRQVYELAQAHGERAGLAATPAPMVVTGYGTFWEGACGDAWVHIPDGRSPFVRWLSKMEIGYPVRPGRQVFSKLQTQSLVKHEAYANAFAGVLLANGIECNVQTRLD